MKTLTLTKTTIAASLLCLASLAHAGVTVYTFIGFFGSSRELNEGSYRTRDIGLDNNEISSVKVPEGWKAVLYDEDNFRGRSLDLTQNAYNLNRENNFNDLTSSIVISRISNNGNNGNNSNNNNTGNQVNLFEGNDYQGNTISLNVGQYSYIEDTGFRNDKLSSLQIPRGYTVTLFQHRDFQGKKIVLSESSAALPDFNDQASSLIIERAFDDRPVVVPPRERDDREGRDGRDGRRPTQVRLFEEESFEGAGVILPVGRYANARAIGLRNDSLSSLQIPRGYQVTLYENENFTGRKMVFSDSIGFLGDYDFNDTTSSLIISQRGKNGAITTPPRDNGLRVTVYTDSDYNGQYSELAIGRYNLNDTGLTNDSISSLKVPKGLKVTLFENQDFSGQKLVLRAGVKDLYNIDFNDITSSIIVDAD